MLNDFNAVALARARLGLSERWQLGGGEPEPGASTPREANVLAVRRDSEVARAMRRSP